MTTPKHGHEPITMRKVEGFKGMERPGDYYIQPARMTPGTFWLAVAVPSAGARPYSFSRIPVVHGSVGSRAVWGWNGSHDCPTVEGSLHVVEDWHGHIRDGQLIEC